MNLLEAQDWTFPIPIAYGPGRLKEIGRMCSTTGMTRPLIVTDRGSRDLPSPTSCDDHDVHPRPQPHPHTAKPLSNPPLQPIPRDSASDPTTHRDTKPRDVLLMCVRRRHHEDDEVPIRRALAMPGDVPEIPGTEETVHPPEAARPSSHEPYFEGVPTVSRFRPLLRRRLITARPARVFIRARKP